MKTFAAPILCLLLYWSASAASADAPVASAATLYDSDPRHPWNRLHDALFVRTAPDGQRYGSGELDILFWSNTQHLLIAPSHETALRELAAFIRNHGERLIRDPLKRALLQRDLWELFDWSAESSAEAEKERAELQRRLVLIIKRLALSAEEIARLPDNYAEAEAHLNAADLPRGMFAENSDWLIVGTSYNLTASEHVRGFGGRSIFLVLTRFPQGREQAQDYFKTLRDFEPALIYLKGMPSGLARPPMLRTNPHSPQFPAHTQWALVRRLCLIDDHGHLRATPLIESIETREYAAIPAIDAQGQLVDARELHTAQRFAEFQLNRWHAPALRAIVPGERDFQFVHFRSQGVDAFEQTNAADWARDLPNIRGETLRECFQCHAAPGILSVNTYAAFDTAAHALDASTVEREIGTTLAWKSAQFDWGLLQGLWRVIP